MTKEIVRTIGFAWNEGARYVTLAMPTLTNDKWNGIKGEAHPVESARACTSRSFLRATGILIDPARWQCFHLRAQNEGGVKVRTYCMTVELTQDEETAVDSMSVLNSLKDVLSERVSSFTLMDVENISYGDGDYDMEYLTWMSHTWHRYPNRRWIEG